eukprot:8342019-Pyramimonas_sp.AAC.1
MSPLSSRTDRIDVGNAYLEASQAGSEETESEDRAASPTHCRLLADVGDALAPTAWRTSRPTSTRTADASA